MNSIQAAIYQHLAAALAPVPVYDQVPRDRPGVYVVIGDHTAVPWDDDNSKGVEHTITVAAYSTNTGQSPTASGYKSVKAVAESLYNALHLHRLTIDGRQVLPIVFEFEQTQRDNDGTSRQIVQRYRLITHN